MDWIAPHVKGAARVRSAGPAVAVVRVTAASAALLAVRGALGYWWTRAVVSGGAPHRPGPSVL